MGRRRSGLLKVLLLLLALWPAGARAVDESFSGRWCFRLEKNGGLLGYATVTAQQVRSYKPAPGHFLTARERIGGRRWLHAAQSHFHDVTPARRLGVPVAWINRKRQVRGEPRPDRELYTLTELADWLA